MPSLHAVLETSLYVRDLARAIDFYRRVLGLRFLEGFTERRGAALRVGPSVLLLFDATKTRRDGVFPQHGADGEGHVAFRVEPTELDGWRERLLEHGVAIEKELQFNGQPPSLYFRDPDGNLLELAVASIWPLQET